MEQKMIKVPFDIELAKKITNGEIDGRVITEDGRPVKIVYFSDNSTNVFCVLYVINAGEDGECSYWAQRNGSSEEETADLMLEVPEYVTFKEGDMLSSGEDVFILKDIKGKNRVTYYACTFMKYDMLDSDILGENLMKSLRKATEDEKERLKNRLKESKEPKAKEYLKRFFGIEQKQEYEFKPKDWILCRCGKSEWTLCQFSHIHKKMKKFISVNGIFWDIAIPYNEKTKHLLGTTDNWEE